MHVSNKKGIVMFKVKERENPVLRTERRKKLLGSIFSIIIPITLQNLIGAAVNTADVVMLGHLDQISLSSTSLANQISIILFMFYSGLTSGMMIMTSQYWGKKQTHTMRTLMGMGLRVSLIVSVLFTVLTLTVPQYLMMIYTNDPELIRSGAVYLRVMGISFLFTGISQIYECTIKSMDRAKKAASFAAVALVVNIVLNAVLIFGLCGMPSLGIIGAAIATVVSRIVEMILCVAYSYKTDEFRLDLSLLKEWSTTLQRDFAKYSLPALGNEFLWGAGFSCYTIVLGHMGTDIVAANAIVSSIRELCSVFVFGAGYGTAIIIGNAIGAGEEENARRNASDMMLVVLAASAITGVLIMMLGPVILKMTELTQGAEHDLLIMLRINCIYVIGMGMNTAFICGLFRAGGDSKYGLVLDTITMWAVFVPLAFICAFLLKLPPLVVYTITCSDEFFKLPLNTVHFLKGKWIRNITRDEDEIA